GGKNVASITHRNDAIELTWLQRLLAPRGVPETWTYFAKRILNHFPKVNPPIPESARVDFLYQRWAPSTRKLPKLLARMIKVARKYKLTVDDIQLNLATKRAVPLWYHLADGEDSRNKNNTPTAKCLRTRHGLIRVGETVDWLGRTDPGHSNSWLCLCSSCLHDRNALGCSDPARCREHADSLLRDIPPKWSPLVETHRRPVPPQRVINSIGNAIAVLDTDTDPSRAELYRNEVRIFAESEPHTGPEATNRVYTSLEPAATVIICSAGRQKLEGDGDNIRSGAAVFLDLDRQAVKYRSTSSLHAPLLGELSALAVALTRVEPEKAVLLMIESRAVHRALTTDLDRHEKTGWIAMMDEERTMFKTILAVARGRSGYTLVQEQRAVQAEHRSLVELTFDLAEDIEDLYDDTPVVACPPRGFSLLGIPLRAGKQSTFYKIIQDQHRPSQRRRTNTQVARVRHAITEVNGSPPTTEDIWLSTRDKDSPATHNNFTFKSLHDGFRLGDHWSTIPGYEDRARCNLCEGEVESMEHILLECPGRLAPIRTVWGLARSLCEMRGIIWPEMTYGLILGCGLVKLKTPKGRHLAGASRLLRIVVRESAHLIWSLRCERVNRMAQNPPQAHDTAEVRNRWIKRLNHRLTMDRLLTCKSRFGTKALDKKLVLRTW
ncbi:hypothetical protein CONPUDRAFT_28441, partial [Coniophora puteana RWD-64-598 SS2]